MRFSSRSKVSIALTILALAVVIGGLAVTGAFRGQTSGAAHAAANPSSHPHINCGEGADICTEVYDSETLLHEEYVGHDEPSLLFYSNVPGSGNHMRYKLVLPKDPAPTPNPYGKSFNFELHPAFWFGMAMCDTQSYPELVSTCTPDSDSNIVDPAVSPNHPGTAFMEMQFYPPGWAPFQLPGGISCDATKWCAALNIDSLSENAVTGQTNNATCVNQVGIEPVNFAFITKNGKAQAPANPTDATAATFTPNPAKDLFMNSGDSIIVTLHDTAHGLQIVLQDLTTGQTGSMTSSAANGFGQVKFDPTGTGCTNIPYDFHPMYSTSSEMTRVPWAAHSYNIAFSDEIGHFDFCSAVSTTGTCTGNEGHGKDTEATDADDTTCQPASASLRVKVSGCTASNQGFDGNSYLRDWPDGNTALHPTPITFTSPRTGPNGTYDVNYSRVAFEADLPRIEFTNGICNRTTGAGCTLIPITDDNNAADFYPYYSISNHPGDACTWMLGAQIPGSTNNFGRNAQYGKMFPLTYTAVGGGTRQVINDFRQILAHNPCPAPDID
jgi:hypothetical protein